MPAANLLALIDDIALLLDDVTVMSKIAAKKTAGVLGDDLALNAEQVTGVEPTREIPVVWAVAKGSAVNKVILVPAALGISAVAHFLILPLLVVGGTFLCYEGFEKVAHKLFGEHKTEDKKAHEKLVEAVANPAVDMVDFEKAKIKGAVRTDFILSAEIIVISLGTVAEKPLLEQLLVLLVISVAMTIGVYGLVAGIVKLDDAGMWLSGKSGGGAGAKLQRALGRGVLAFAPLLMKFLSLAGTTAMFLVGGGIVVHAIGPVHKWLEATETALESSPGGGLWSALLEAAVGGGIGLVVGALALGIVTLAKKLRAKPA
jgi:predicted DNA repair protein MutK